MNRNGIRMPGAAVAFVAVCLGAAGAALSVADEGGLRVTVSGVGSGIENRELVGEADTFREGAQVVFFTRVEGGSDGDAVDHVWIREGREVVTVGLSLGSSSWRTWSRKELRPGDAGAWSIEARDPEGRVLATATFTCVASGE